MTSLLAVVLVVSSSRGHHFVFSYPANPRRNAGNRGAGLAGQKPEGADSEAAPPLPQDAWPLAPAGTGAPSPASSAAAPAPDASGTASPDGPSAGRMHSQPSASRHPPTKAGAPHGGSQRRWNGGGEADGAKHQQLFRSNGAAAVSDVQTVLGYNTQFLANVLTPKRSLCDRRFQMTVGDLTFLGHPVYTGSEGEQDAGGRGRRLSGPPYSAPAAGVGEFQTFLGRSSVSHPSHRRVPSMSAIPLAGGTSHSWRSGRLATAPSQAVGSSSSSAPGLMPTSTASSPEINFLHPKGDSTPTERSSASSPVPASTPFTADVGAAGHTGATPGRASSILLTKRTPAANQRSTPPADSMFSGAAPPTRPGGAPLRHNSVPMVLTNRATAGTLAAACAHQPHSAISQTPGSSGTVGAVSVLPTPALQSTVVSPLAGEIPHASGDLTASSTSTASSPSGFGFPCPPLNTATAASGVPSGPTSATQTTSFHLAFILDPDPLERNRVTEEMYRQVVRKLTMALRHEQARCRYVSIEAEKILKIKDGAVLEGFTQEETLSAVLSASSLARDLSRLYHALVSDRIARIVVNGYLDLSLQVPKIRLPDVVGSVGPATEVELGSAGFDGARSDADFHHAAGALQLRADDVAYCPPAGVPRFAPYFTLLLLKEKEEILRGLPADASGVLIKFLEVLTPTKCFAELHIICETSLAQLYKVAAHLVYWQKARVIDVISSRNVYVVSPNADLNTVPELTIEITKRFPNSTIHLPVLLASLSPPRPFSALIPSRDQRSAYLGAVAFLLARGIIVQLHTYVYLLIPPHVKLGLLLDEYERLGYGSALAAVAGDTARIVSMPAQSTEMERDWISKMAKGQPRAVAEHFLSLLQYFNGTHSVDEIMFRESIARRDLKSVIASFREELITVMHYDRTTLQ